MRIGWVTGSAYEWTQHWRVATTAGIPPEDILAVRDWRNSERLTPADRAILAATDECRRQIHFGCRLRRGGETCHRARTAGRIHHRHGQLDDVFAVVPKPAHSAGGGSDGLAARWSGLPGGAAIGDRRNGCERAGGFSDRPARPGSMQGMDGGLLSDIFAVDDEFGAGNERRLVGPNPVSE
jgi:hypothetical protein